MRCVPFSKRPLLVFIALSMANASINAETQTNKPAHDVIPKQPEAVADSTDTVTERIQSEPLQTGDEKPAAAQPKHNLDAFELPDVDVLSTTPLGVTGLDAKKVSGNVQTAEDEEINRHGAISVSDFLNRRLESVNINETQNNPFQPDVTYRGFTASPLLGTPIGLSVYQDGVRVNEAFGDTVNWDLIPQVAIANLEVIPGSNPLFGLNTLGGALSIKTKSGFSHPGYHAQAYGGSFGRQAYQAEAGGYRGQFDWYFAGNIFEDNGWRPFSPSRVRQAFGKIGWENDNSDLDLSFTYADNNLQGVGPTPQEILQQEGRSAIYTAPDITKNTLYFINLKGSHRFTDRLELSGTAYYRNNDSSNTNSNFNESCDSFDTVTSCPNTNDPAQPDPTVPGSFAVAAAKQNGHGINLQLTSDYSLGGHENQMTVGGGYNYGRTRFNQATQLAVFNSNLFEIPVSELTPDVQLIGRNTYVNAFATDTFSVYDWLHVNASINWIQAKVENSDLINAASDPNFLGANVTYQRANPSAGFTVNPLDALGLKTPIKELTAYFNYNEGFRAPTAIELGCSNPEVACTLPNSLASDPPNLKAVVSHTFETGLRGKLTDDIKWNFALYQTVNTNDILFESAATNGNTTQGFFANVDKTQRQGLEAGLSGSAGESLNWYVSYGYVDATYQSPALLQNAFGEEHVKPGDRIPGIPQNTVKFGAEYEVFHNFFLGGDVQYASGQFARGDDQNINPKIPSYTVVNLNSRYKLNKHIELFAQGRNVLDETYYTFAQLGQNFYTGQSTQFQSPGAVATGYAGIRVHWE